MSKLLIKIDRVGQGVESRDRLFQWLEKAGAAFVNPSVGKVTTWTDEGDQIVTTAEAAAVSLREGRKGSIQMWFSLGRDVFMTWTDETVFLFLDGSNQSERKAVIDAISAWFLEACDGRRPAWTVCIGDEDALVAHTG